MKLSMEASSSALTTKLFMMSRSFMRKVMLSEKKSASGLYWSALTSECTMGMSTLMRLYNLNIQMNLILVPLLNTSS